jgi:DNA-binding response OmpR family regulator
MEKILLLEDDKKIARALAIRLKAAGYEVLIESNGWRGIKTAVKSRPDLILSDIWLPGVSGLGVAQRLKARNLGEVPVIFVTASRKESLWQTSQELGATALLEKPFDPDRLLSLIERTLSYAAEPACQTTSLKPTD